MAIRLVFTATICLFLVSCRHEPAETLKSDCVDAYIQAHQLLPYTGQELGCNTFVSLYQLGGEDYFLVDNPCADMIVNPVDCAGKTYAPDVESPLLSYFFTHAVFVRVIGVKP